MPPRGRKDPSLLSPDGEQGPQIELSPEEAQDNGGMTEPGDVENVVPLMYEGELLQTSMTLAVTLPGDHKESYFGSRFVGRLQLGELDDELVARGITVVRETCIAQIDDAIDALAEYQKQLAARLK